VNEAEWSVDAALAVLRNAMEGLLVPEIVAEILFEAVADFTELPKDREQFQAFVHGPLTKTITRRLGADGCDAVLVRIHSVTDEVAPILELEVEIGVEGNEDPTSALNFKRSAACVMVFAASPALERQLRLAVGSRLVTFTASSQVDLHASLLARAPRLVVIDARDPAPIQAHQLGKILGFVRSDALVVVWHSESEYGAKVGMALQGASVPVVCIDARHGVEPLLDVVRSHGMSGPGSTPSMPAVEAEPVKRTLEERMADEVARIEALDAREKTEERERPAAAPIAPAPIAPAPIAPAPIARVVPRIVVPKPRPS
jgi:hypothetical protein